MKQSTKIRKNDSIQVTAFYGPRFRSSKNIIHSLRRFRRSDSSFLSKMIRFEYVL